MSILRWVWILCVVAPLVNLAAGRTSWPYIVWAAVSVPFGLLALTSMGMRRNAKEAARPAPKGETRGGR